MGLGKSVIVLTALADLMSRFEVARALIIAPLRVARSVWPAEIERWDHTRHLTYRLVTGTPRQRLARLRKDRSDIHIVNRELTAWLVENLCDDWPYDMVVIDEASSFKSARTRRFKALRKVLKHIDRLVELTGTPASNGLLDLWSQIFLLDRGERLGRTFTGFRARYFISDYQGYEWTPREGAEAQIHNRLKDVCLALTAEDYLKLPRRIDNTIEVELPDRARARYRLLEKDFLVQLDDNDTVAVFNAAALTNKLLQFANGAVYTDGDGRWTAVHDAKLEALAELVEAAAGRPVLVAYHYQTDLRRILERFKQAVPLDRDPDTIARWNRGDIPLLLAHPASAGHGLNLQAGGHTIVWFGLTWSLEAYRQLNARLLRQGQTRPVVVHHLVARDSVDETVMAALGAKDATQRALLDALKRDIAERLNDV